MTSSPVTSSVSPDADRGDAWMIEEDATVDMTTEKPNPTPPSQRPGYIPVTPSGRPPPPRQET